jgi:sec-independent protein translocase protein TatA
MIGNIGFPELVVILAIVLLLFGANKLPETARSLGKAIREFKKAASGIEEETTKTKK